MGKKGGGQNSDSIARMNFLYQASHLMVSLHCENMKEKTLDKNDSGYLALSRLLSEDMVKISKKTVVRMYNAI